VIVNEGLGNERTSIPEREPRASANMSRRKLRTADQSTEIMTIHETRKILQGFTRLRFAHNPREAPATTSIGAGVPLFSSEKSRGGIFVS